MRLSNVKQIAVILPLFLVNTCLSWTIDEKNFTRSVAFNFDTTDVEIPCWYPISGNYGRLPRILFYCTVVFGLLASRFEWLIAGALAVALTYSGSAAIHACFLIWRGPAYGELDLYPVIAILTTSCLVTVPLINWSDTLRRLGSRDGDDSGARMIIVYWGALVVVGLITALTTVWNSTYYGSNFSTLNSITCNPPGSRMNYTAGQDLSWHHLTVNAEWIQENGCTNPCQHSSFLWPPTIFRTYSDLQLLSRADIGILYSYLAVHPSSEGVFKFFDAYAYFGVVAGAFVVCEGIWALCFGRNNPRQIRDIVYSFIARMPIRFQVSQPRRSASTRFRKRIAKYSATLAYFWAVIATLISVLLFLVNIVVMELLLVHFPQSESAIHVGAWSPWTNIGLVILATFIGKFHQRLTRSTHGLARRLFNNVGRRMGREKQVQYCIQEDHQGDEQLPPERPKALSIEKQTYWARRRELRIVWLASNKLMCVGRDLKEEWVSLKAFWNNPDEALYSSSIP